MSGSALLMGVFMHSRPRTGTQTIGLRQISILLQYEADSIY